MNLFSKFLWFIKFSAFKKRRSDEFNVSSALSQAGKSPLVKGSPRRESTALIQKDKRLEKNISFLA